MTSQSWLIAIRDAEKTCLIQDGERVIILLTIVKNGNITIPDNIFFFCNLFLGKRKVHYKFSDGKEMVEEYSLDTNCVIRRAWKCNKKFGSQPYWDVEVGDPEPEFTKDLDTIGISETSTAVCVI